MPSIAKSNMWFVRVNGQKDFLEEKLKQLMGWIDCVGLLAAFHVGEKKENPHIHFCIKMVTVLQKQSFDVRVKGIFKPDKKTSWSSKVWDGQDSALSYLFHEETAEVLANKGHTEADIVRYIKLNDDVQKVIAVNKERGAKRVVERVLVEIGQQCWTRRDIFKRLIEMIRDGEMYEPGDFMLKRYVEEIYMKSLPESHFMDYVDTRYDDIFRRQ